MQPFMKAWQKFVKNQVRLQGREDPGPKLV
jgi:hypothetical protein